ncbi:MAG: helix-turn-helix transcriptional regulator [Burkholderiales bacterium]|nr:helix-turn-helix transcriptional regulator [Burkholderiales bacterium]
MGSVLPHVARDEAAEAAYLARLGARVRIWRQERGLARKALALASGVSERYLAQLESGHGNVSVLLLRKLARAMNVPIEHLVRENGDPPAALGALMQLAGTLSHDRLEAAHRLLQTQFGTPRRHRIALLGLRGAGKSTLGAKLAQALGASFVELDREVEREAGAELGDVFSIYGQDAYRRFERRALERVLRHHDRAVIATGGSIVSEPETYRLLRERCFCVWLRASPEEHMARVIAQGDMRPFRGRAEALEEIRRLLADRDRLYARADATIDTSGQPVRQSMARLRALVGTE